MQDEFPKLHPELCPDPRSKPELHLLANVVMLALSDLKGGPGNPRRAEALKAEAKAFFESVDFDLFCELLDWNAEVIRERVV
jgi:hypothetical protein